MNSFTLPDSVQGFSQACLFVDNVENVFKVFHKMLFPFSWLLPVPLKRVMPVQRPSLNKRLFDNFRTSPVAIRNHSKHHIFYTDAENAANSKRLESSVRIFQRNHSSAEKDMSKEVTFVSFQFHIIKFRQSF